MLPYYFHIEKRHSPPITLSNKMIIPISNIRYLGLILDQRLTWAEHAKQKRILLNTRRKSLYHRQRNTPHSSLQNKLILHKNNLVLRDTKMGHNKKIKHLFNVFHHKLTIQSRLADHENSLVLAFKLNIISDNPPSKQKRNSFPNLAKKIKSKVVLLSNFF